MNEVQAAYGLLQLKYVDENIDRRRDITEYYRRQLHNLKGISYLEDMEGVRHTYSYFPILIDSELYGKTRDEVYEDLKKYNIFSRRYFYPLISQFPTYKGLLSSAPGNLPNAEMVAEKVICLPIYPELDEETIQLICDLIKE